MDKKLIEDVAQAIQRQHGKEMFGEIQKWEKRPARERSSWRLVARAAINVIDPGALEADPESGAPEAETPARPPTARPRRRRTPAS